MDDKIPESYPWYADDWQWESPENKEMYRNRFQQNRKDDMKKIYDTGKDKWTHGEIISRHSNGNSERWLLGPCPKCGSRTSNYGGGYSCHSDSCPMSACNFVCNNGGIPDWWETVIDVKLDGDAWCATGHGFVNLQESDAGFGATPREAVEALRNCIAGVTDSPCLPTKQRG